MTMEIFDLEKTASAEQVLERVKTLGIARIQGYLDDVSPIKSELDNVYDNMEANYQFGKAIRSDNGSLPLDECPNIVKFFRGSRWMEEIARGYQFLRMGFQQDIFATHDFLHDQGLATQGWVHFDRLQRFKFFLHVTDIPDESYGPFCAALGSHKITPELRKRSPNPAVPDGWRFGRDSGDAGEAGPNDDQRTEGLQNHFPDIEYELTPMTGPAGTLLIFDADVFHKGGTLGEGKERSVIRGHSW